MRPQSIADFSDCAEIQKRLLKLADEMAAMSTALALARQVREFSSDRRKKTLAVAAMPFLNDGESSASAETKARASSDYATQMQQMAKELITAEKVIADFESKKVQWESARSLLSMVKSQMSNL